MTTIDDLPEKIRSRMVIEDGCWRWTGPKHLGYAYVSWGGRKGGIHRTAYLMFVGPIPDGYEVDHVCHNEDLSCHEGPNCPHRACFNPDHLEAVTREENMRRKLARITHCPQGHEYTEENTSYYKNGARRCNTCAREKCRAHHAANRDRINANRREKIASGAWSANGVYRKRVEI